MKKKYKKKYWYFVFVFLVVLLIFPYSISEMSSALLKNAQLMGQEIARRFALSEDTETRQYEIIIETMEYELRYRSAEADIPSLMSRYMKYVEETMEIKEIDVYASINGKIQGMTYWEGDASFDPLQTEWYQKAIQANGETIYTDAYEDVVTHQNVVTLAKQIQGTKDVVAIDIYPAKLRKEDGKSELPEESFYLLCDSNGTLLDHSMNTDATYDYDELQKRCAHLLEEIKAGKHDKYDSYVTGLDGRKRGVYYYRLRSGWYSVITIPYNELLASTNSSWKIFMLVLGTFLLMTVVFLILDCRNAKKTKLYNDIVEMLGNSYYALYVVNLEEEQYFILKGSEYMKEKISSRGRYERFLETLQEVIHINDREEFLDTFSIENMKQLVDRQVRDFGGDFKRLFYEKYHWVHVQMLYDESFQKNSVVLCFRDVNDIKEQELSRLEFLKKSLETVDTMARSRNIFFSQISHDMRTPLNGIIGLANLTMQKKEYYQEYIEKIIMLSNQLLGLINDILDISKIEEGKVELANQRFKIKEHLKDTGSVFDLQAQGSGQTFLQQIDVEDIWVLGDWRKLQQILNNLLSNAFKFTDASGCIELIVKETVDHNSKFRKYNITVRDNGAGMSEEFLKKLFIPFERETKFGAANVTGTGLGMPIVHELVHKMGGTIDVTSKLGEGSTFMVMLPFRIAEEEGKEMEESRETSENKTITLEGKRVLLTEDNRINMEIASEVLELYGLEIVQAWNGKEAVEIFESHDENYFDFILMDMQMPVMDGCEAAQIIRKMKRKDAKTIPIIAVTANAFPEDIAQTQRAGMNAHISKPIDFNILKETVIKLLEH